VPESKPITDKADEIVRETVVFAAELLDEPELSAKDNFLDLGGHSMLALELSEWAKERYGASISMELIFERSIGEAAADMVRRVDA